MALLFVAAAAADAGIDVDACCCFLSREMNFAVVRLCCGFPATVLSCEGYIN